MLACVKAAGKAAPRVHVYGFNWSGKHWMTHQVNLLQHGHHLVLYHTMSSWNHCSTVPAMSGVR